MMMGVGSSRMPLRMVSRTSALLSPTAILCRVMMSNEPTLLLCTT